GSWSAYGATIYFHKEKLRFEPNKEDPFQKLMLPLLSSVAEFERNCILQRQREGIAIAKAQGRYKGRQSRFSEAQLDQIRTEFEEERNKTALAHRWGISRGYLYKIAAKGEASPA
ncbi:recombinase family protein, partial [Marinobacter salexigens]